MRFSRVSLRSVTIFTALYVLAHESRGVALGAAGEFATALRDFDAAIGLAPNKASLYHNRGLTRLMASDAEGAIADFSHSLDLNADAVVLFHRAKAFDQAGRAEAAREDAEAALFVGAANKPLVRQIEAFVARLDGRDADLLAQSA